MGEGNIQSGTSGHIWGDGVKPAFLKACKADNQGRVSNDNVISDYICIDMLEVRYELRIAFLTCDPSETNHIKSSMKRKDAVYSHTVSITNSIKER